MHVDPVAVADFRGVLVTLADVQDLADANDQLRAEIEAAHQREAVLRTALVNLQATVRTLLAPVVGYLQLIVRRPQALASRPVDALLDERVLPRLREVVTVVDQASGPPTDASRTHR